MLGKLLQRPIFAHAVEHDLNWVMTIGLRCDPLFRSAFLSLCGAPEPSAQLIGLWQSLWGPGHGESDIAVLLDQQDGRKLAVLIENKIDAEFQPDQAARYQSRGANGVSEGLWDDFLTCLCAPATYVDIDAKSKWNAVIITEDLQGLISARSDPLSLVLNSALAAIGDKFQRSGVLLHEGATRFWASFSSFVAQEHPNLQVTGVGRTQSGSGAVWPRFGREQLPSQIELELKPAQGRVDLTFRGAPPDIIRQVYGSAIDPGHSVLSIGRGTSGAIRAHVPKLDDRRPFEEQIESARVCLSAVQRLFALARAR